MPLLIILLLLACTTASAATSDILGVWVTDGGDSKVELFRCEDKICGKVVWLKDPKYRDNQIGPIGTEKTDRKNPNPSLRGQPIVGLRVIEGLVPAGRDEWDGGNCYDPKSGKSYQCKMRLVAANQLELRGYIGISLIGRTFLLTR